MPLRSLASASLSPGGIPAREQRLVRMSAETGLEPLQGSARRTRSRTPSSEWQKNTGAGLRPVSVLDVPSCPFELPAAVFPVGLLIRQLPGANGRVIRIDRTRVRLRDAVRSRHDWLLALIVAGSLKRNPVPGCAQCHSSSIATRRRECVGRTTCGVTEFPAGSRNTVAQSITSSASARRSSRTGWLSGTCVVRFP